jgi:hypothetical protein
VAKPLLVAIGSVSDKDEVGEPGSKRLTSFVGRMGYARLGRCDKMLDEENGRARVNKAGNKMPSAQVPKLVKLRKDGKHIERCYSHTFRRLFLYIYIYIYIAHRASVISAATAIQAGATLLPPRGRKAGRHSP